MRKFLRTILRILDGSPSIHMATRNRQRGQSMLELAFITPLLAILIVGASEIGWYTNRWLSLLEVTRVGARSATFLQSGLSAPEWDNRASIVPAIQEEIFGVDPLEDSYRFAENARNCDTGSNFGFYSFIVCLMQDSLDPLELTVDTIDPIDADEESQEIEEEKYTIHPDNQEIIDAGGDASSPGYDPSKDRDLALAPVRDIVGHDDIVISVFAIQNVNNARFTGTETSSEGVVNGRPVYRTYESGVNEIDPISSVYKVTVDLNAYAEPPDYPPGRQAIVVGRYPQNANECNYTGTHNGNKTLLADGDPGYEKDPFDYLDTNASGNILTGNSWDGGVTVYLYEMTDEEGNSLADAQPEIQRGWALTGQHKVSDPNLFCYGSEFSIQDVQELINMPGFITPNIWDPPTDDVFAPEYEDWLDEVYESQSRREFFEPQGMTLVEIFWEHQLLLDFPLARPLQEAYGEGDIVIALWSAFPLPSIAPNITYQLP